MSLPRSKRQSTDTGVAAGLGARSRRQSTGASAPLPPELLPAALSHELEPAATPRAREMHRRSSECASFTFLVNGAQFTVRKYCNWE